MDETKLSRFQDLPKEKLVSYWLSLYEQEKQNTEEIRVKYQPDQILQELKKQVQAKNTSQACQLFFQYLNQLFFYSFSPIWYFIQIYRLIESKEFRELTQVLLDMNARNSRLTIRENFIKNAPSTTTQIGLVLFILGGTLNFSKRKYLKSVFISQTLPTLSNRYEHLNWDTFHFSFEKNLPSFNLKENILWTEDNFLIETNNSQIVPFSKSFMTVIRDSKTNQTRLLTSIPPQYYKVTPTTFHLHLDELPVKLGNLFPENEKDIVPESQKKTPKKSRRKQRKYPSFSRFIQNEKFPEIRAEVSYKELEKFIITEKNFDTREVLAVPLKIQKRQKQKNELPNTEFDAAFEKLMLVSDSYSFAVGQTLNDSNLLPLYFEEDLEIKQDFDSATEQENIDVEEFESDFSHQQRDQLNQKELNLLTEDRKKDYDKISEQDDLIFLQEFDETSNVDSNQILEEDISTELKSLIQEIDNHIIFPQVIPTRQMSSYRYPDMESTEVESFLKSNLWPWQKTFLRISNPPTFTTASYYPISYLTRPNFTIAIKETVEKFTLPEPENPNTVSGSEENNKKVKKSSQKRTKKNTEKELGEKGVVMVLNTIRDWKTKPELVKNQTSNQSYSQWLQTYLSTKNPLLFFKEDFSGFYQKQDLYKETKKILTKQNDIELPKIQKFKEDWFEKLRTRLLKKYRVQLDPPLEGPRKFHEILKELVETEKIKKLEENELSKSSDTLIVEAQITPVFDIEPPKTEFAEILDFLELKRKAQEIMLKEKEIKEKELAESKAQEIEKTNQPEGDEKNKTKTEEEQKKIKSKPYFLQNLFLFGDAKSIKMDVVKQTDFNTEEDKLDYLEDGPVITRMEQNARVFEDDRSDKFKGRAIQNNTFTQDFRTFPTFPRNFQSNFQTSLAIPQFMSKQEWEEYYKKYIFSPTFKTKFKDLTKLTKTTLDLPLWRDLQQKEKTKTKFGLRKKKTTVQPVIEKTNFPILQVELPVDKNPIFEFSIEDKVDYKISGILGSLKQVSFEFPIPTQTSTDSFTNGIFNPTANYMRGSRSSAKLKKRKPNKLYKPWMGKLAFVLNPNFQKGNWEGIDSAVWAGFSRIGFWLVFYDFLRTWTQNCTREVLTFLRSLFSKLGYLPEDVRQALKFIFGPQEPSFQIIYNSPKKFSDIAGTGLVLRHIWKIVISLRAARQWGGKHISKDIPKALLLTGPPGTGKTLLVQAIGGETQIPIISLSGSSLFGPGDTPLARLERIFNTAKWIAPCIIFIDEIDSLLRKRADMSHLERPGFVANLIYQPLLESDPYELQKFDMPVRKDESGFRYDMLQGTTFQEKLQSYEDINQLRIQTDEHYRQEDIRQSYKYALLLQFILELDQIKFRNDVFVIGATNRLDAIDAAALRPGRFDKILELGLPNEQKRLEIIKFYGKQRGFSATLEWDFLVRRTDGFSAADLAAIINQSTLFSIFNGTFNNLETIETAIDRIITLEIRKPKVEKQRSFQTARLAYYEAGKILISALLKYHPPVIVAHLWPHRPNVRALQIEKNLYTRFFNEADRLQLEELSIGCYAGKAAEILFINDIFSDLSDFGMEDLEFGHHVIKFMVAKSLFYSKHQATQVVSRLENSRNSKVYRPEQVDYYGRMAERFESEPYWTLVYPQEYIMFREPQLFFSMWWWERYTYLEFTMHERIWSHWIRYYFPIPVRRRLYNIEWIKQDKYFHGEDLLKPISGDIKWNNLLGIHQDYQIHSLILQSFNTALCLLDQYREIVDKLAYELVQKETLRDYEINEIFQQFDLQVSKHDTNKEQTAEEFKFPKRKEPLVVTSSWGPESRRNIAKWIDFEHIQQSRLNPSKTTSSKIESENLTKIDSTDFRSIDSEPTQD